MPKVGPILGCRTFANATLFRWLPRAWVSPTVVVDFPSPRGVGVIPLTRMYLPFLRCAKRDKRLRSTFALYAPYGSSSCGAIPISLATWVISLGCCDREMAISDGTG